MGGVAAHQRAGQAEVADKYMAVTAKQQVARLQVAVDDALGFVYYSDERFGIRKYRADPDAPDAATELASFGTDGRTSPVDSAG